MKKVLFLLVIVLFHGTVVLGINGDGTASSPYNGALTMDMTFGPGEVYINGDITNSGYFLTIAPGTIILIETDIDIFITGGIISAIGTSESPIFFKPWHLTWGHIYMEVSGDSEFGYCTFESGRSSGSDDGGAIWAVNSGPVSISNCEFRNNYSNDRGGAIYSGGGSYLTIRDCLFHDNEANKGISTGRGGAIFSIQSGSLTLERCRIYSNTAYEGAGIYMANEASSVNILNTLIYNNNALNTIYPSAGGIWGGGTSTVRLQYIINCVISNNTPNDVTISQRERIRFLNTSIWGSAYSVHFYAGTYLQDNLKNCAIKNIIPVAINIGSFPTSFLLNASNSAVDGPNFKDPANNDYSIIMASPLRDAGTSSVTPAPPITDILGNGRIGNYDIGAYEVQYSRWTGTTSNVWDLSNNWQGGVPTSASDVIIPGELTNYPTSSSLQDYTIGSGKQFVIEPSASATLGTLTNNGILKLKSSSSGIASLLLNTYNRGAGGTEEIQLYLTGGEASPENYRWHYISSPVTPSIPASIFESQTQDLAKFDESLYDGTAGTGWIASDGFVYSSEETGTGFDDLLLGEGYNFWDNIVAPSIPYTFGGFLNTSPLTGISLRYSGEAEPPSETYGFNLLGNPFSCGIDWDVITSESNNYPANTSKAIFFTRDNAECSYINGVGVPETTTSHIPPMQGFFVKTYSTGNSLNIPLSAREHNSTARYKGTKSEIPLVRLMISEFDESDETVIRFDNMAKIEFDYDYDAVKMSGTSGIPSISTLTNMKTDMTINGLPFPDTSTEIPLNVRVGQTFNGIHSIKAISLQGLDNYLVFLIDKKDNIIVNLKTNPNFTFAAPEGLVANRFVIRVGSISTGTEDLLSQDKQFKIYTGFELINIQTLADEWEGLEGSVRVADLTGKTIIDKPDLAFSKSSIIQIKEPDIPGIYIVEIRSGLKRFTGKVEVK